MTALERGDDWEDALRLALGAGAANAELAGAARIDPARAAALAEQADVFSFVHSTPAPAVISVTETNRRARGFYEACGFADTGERRPLRQGSDLDVLIFAKTLED